MLQEVKQLRWILIAVCALSLIGCILVSWVLATEDERNLIDVRLHNDQTKEIYFESLGLVPGESCEYTINLKNTNAKKYDLRFDFVEIEDGGLKNFARVKIFSDGEVLYDNLLLSAFDKTDLIFPVDFKEGKNTKLQIVYYMPVEIGNEAKQTDALFKLLLTASNE